MQYSSHSNNASSSSTSRMPTETTTTTTAVPTLRVMRLQSPEMHRSKSAASACGECALQTALCLPDSLAVYCGEHFTAYLGILNSSGSGGAPIRRLTVTAQLQTPSQRFQLPSRLDPSSSGAGAGLDVPADSGVDAIVSRVIEEPGQHILRVEVSYQQAQQQASEGGGGGGAVLGTKTFRKFYRFQVTAPLRIKETTVRVGDSRCLVSVSVEYIQLVEKEKQQDSALMITSSGFEAAPGLTGSAVGSPSPFQPKQKAASASSPGGTPPTALELFDAAGSMVPGGSFSYIFSVQATDKDAVLRGIAAGDYLGRAVFTWRKAMGETGTVTSSAIHCPRAEPVFDRRLEGGGTSNPRLTCSNFVVLRSGLSVDVAAAAASKQTHNSPLASQFPVTVEPIDPPKRLQLNVPVEVQFLVVNHSDHALTLQLQMNLAHMLEGLAVCGHSFKNLGEVKANGGSTVTAVKLLPLQAGLMRVDGCTVVDLSSGREIVQPPLFSVFVDTE